MKRIIIFSMVLGILASCHSDDQDVLTLQNQIEAISLEDLPASSQSFIENNFEGEIIKDAYKVSDANRQVTYEAFMSNNTNLVFDNNSNLYGFGDIHSKVDLDSDMQRGSQQGSMNGGSGGNMGNGSQHKGGGMMGGDMIGQGGMMGNEGEFRGHPEVNPTEVLPDDLPASIKNYVASNYVNSAILKAFLVSWDDIAEYHVLVEGAGALRFDEDGNFVSLVMRGETMFQDMVEIDIADLQSSIKEYISTTYNDAEIVRARQVTLADDSKEIHVVVIGVGVLTFDENGSFVELLSHQGMNRHNG